jgi:hypothetical protein
LVASKQAQKAAESLALEEAEAIANRANLEALQKADIDAFLAAENRKRNEVKSICFKNPQIIEIGQEACDKMHNFTGAITLTHIEKIFDKAFSEIGQTFLDDFEVAPITLLGARVFENSGLKGEVQFPITLDEIGDECFKITNTESVIINHHIASQGNFIFQQNKKLKSLTLADGVEKIPIGMFSECTLLPEVVFPDSVTEVGVYAFRKCDMLAKAEFGGNPDLVISNSAFLDCKSLKDLNFGAGVKSIGSEAFRGCDISESFDFEEQLDNIGAKAFFKGINFSSVGFPSTRPYSIGSSAFEDCKFLNFNFRLEQASSIGALAFSGASVGSLSTFKLGENRSLTIGDRAFAELELRGDSVTFFADFPANKFVGTSHFYTGPRAKAEDEGKKPYYSEVTVTIPDGSFYDEPWSYVYPDNFREKVVDIPHILRGGPFHFETEPITYQYQYYDPDLVVVVDEIASTGNYTSDVLRDETVIIRLSLIPEIVGGGGNYVPVDQIEESSYTYNYEISIDIDASDFNNSNVPNAWKVDSLQGGFLSEPLQYYENLTSHTTAYNAYGYPTVQDGNISYVFNDSIVYKEYWDKYTLRVLNSDFPSYTDSNEWLDKTKFLGKVKIKAP